uniref:Endonuclease/exonuclease/phosphatase domain-containing protein n=2 Tax=Rhizochromulina marina TaxID=1034831 RepID=A0A7S2SSQ8_9STRA|mmetsp:Transcript_66/g.221  ORF Transcript_66/g.221 Transcript_66/m.221 type:complete len:433 (+) Transcript_66:69-1367(+)
MSIAGRHRVRVATFNVLSSHLSSPDYYTACSSAALRQENRLRTCLKHKLQAEVDQNAIICLQEVSTLWAGKLHVFFEERDYCFFPAHYGRPFNGYMGVAMAWPRGLYQAEEVQISRIADTHSSWPSRQRGTAAGRVSTRLAWPSWVSSLRPLLPPVLLNLIAGFFGGGGGGRNARQRTQQDMAPRDPVEEARRRHNMAIVTRLMRVPEGADGGRNMSANATSGSEEAPPSMSTPPPSSTEQSFVVATYHMPCVFWAPQVMAIHTALLVQHVAASAAGRPFVLAGDFNFLPGSACYNLAVTGTMDPADPAYPHGAAIGSSRQGATGVEGDSASESGQQWSPETGLTLRSAYAEDNGHEPEFTNFAKVKDDPEFIGTLDYIFLGGREWRVDGTLPLPALGQVRSGGPFPTLNEPSDHLLIAADLSLPSSKKPAE